MAWRIISIENPARLSVKNNQLLISQKEDVSIPIEDIDSLIIDNYGLNLTTNLLNELSSRAVSIVICDQRHLPITIVLPYSQHSRQAKVSRQQIEMKIPLKKQIWQNNIVRKISNQADVLKYFGLNDEYLRKCASEVKSGDSTNRESLAARDYFSQLLDDTTRRQPMWYNSALNYSYALVRTGLARHLAARGLVVSQGIFHRNELNSFNLADDLIEPYRAIVDHFVLSKLADQHLDLSDSRLTKEDRRLSLDILNDYAIIKDKQFTVRDAIDLTVSSLVQAISDKSPDLLQLPKFNR